MSDNPEVCDVCGSTNLLQIKCNQKDVHAALEACLGAAHETRPAAQTIEKKGTPSNVADCGLI